MRKIILLETIKLRECFSIRIHSLSVITILKFGGLVDGEG
jgi:hypothetical protein